MYLIESANYFPYGETPPSVTDVIGAICYPDAAKRSLSELFAGLPKVLEVCGDPADITTFIETYESLLLVRDVMDRIVVRSAEYRARIKEGEPNWWFRDPVKVMTTLKINYEDERPADGKIRFEGNWITEALSGCLVTRIRRCAVETCGRIFWATKENRESCSDKCSERLDNLKRGRSGKRRRGGGISRERNELRNWWLSQDFGKKEKR